MSEPPEPAAPAEPAAPRAPTREIGRAGRGLYTALWYFAIPLALAWASVQALSSLPEGAGGALVDKLRFFVVDQPIPAGIVFFTLFDMAIVRFRHRLPLASSFGLAGRPGVSPGLGRELEQATHLLEEAETILVRRRRDVERTLPAAAREELEDALTALRELTAAESVTEQQVAEARQRTGALVGRHLDRWRKGEIREYAESIGVAVGVALLLRMFVVEAFKIPSGSMLPTLQIQDHIFVNKFAYGPLVPGTPKRVLDRMPPQRGDVVVFEYPYPPPGLRGDDYIKRVIALEGDVLTVENGHPVLNGWRVPSCRVGPYVYREGEDRDDRRGILYVEHLGESSYLTMYRHEDNDFGGREIEGPYAVQPGEFWVLGDNRDNSSDSRAWRDGRGGGVPYANVKGRAMFVWLSFDNEGRVPFDRLFHRVMGSPILPKGAPPETLARIRECLATRPAETLPPPSSAPAAAR
ncbi:MAG: signal peptidase I [Polyangiaceae bacterium]|nr:signal peptidase I [Polyangiaceae bacterium]